ncbi:MAG TPA: hypothetical protein PKH78_11175, partial [Candidatus Obscuribacter sp.]|nr:hypothetical protein [Candidatus Obscuribacter sp.]
MSRQWIFGGLTVAVLGSLLMGRTYASSTNGIMTSGSNALGNLPRAEMGSAEQIKVHKSMANSELLGGKERFSTFISTDKPIYRAGENVYVRGVLLDSQKLKPLAANQSA